MTYAVEIPHKHVLERWFEFVYLTFEMTNYLKENNINIIKLKYVSKASYEQRIYYRTNVDCMSLDEYCNNFGNFSEIRDFNYDFPSRNIRNTKYNFEIDKFYYVGWMSKDDLFKLKLFL